MVECDICLEEYQEEYLELHRAKCISRLVFRCSRCDEDYVSKEGLWNHMDLHEIEDESKELQCQEVRAKHKLHQCALCNDQRAYSARLYKKHIHDVHDGFMLRCSDCGEKFKTLKLKNKHVLSRCKLKDQTIPIKAGNMTSDAEHLQLTRREQSSNTSKELDRRSRIDDEDSNVINKESELPTVSSMEWNELPLPFACDVCGTTFAKNYLLDRHKRGKYSCIEGRRQSCPYCRKKFLISEYQAHISLCMKRKFPCELCSAKFNRKKHLTDHMKSVHRNGRDLSSSSINKESELRTTPLPFACDVCGTTFARSNLLDRHKRAKYSCMEGRRQPCPHCRRRFLKKEYQAHISLCMKRKFSCELCSVKFQKRKHLTAHIKNVHHNDGEALKKAKQMGKASKRSGPETLTSSSDSCSSSKAGEDRDISTAKKNLADTSVVSKLSDLKCSYCGKNLANSLNLRQHIVRFHQPTKCSICGITFEGYVKARYHRITKHVKPKFKCAKCSKRFYFLLYFKRHLDICGQNDDSNHNNSAITLEDTRDLKTAEENPSNDASCTKCSRCGIEESSPDTLARHKLMHHDPVACDYCGLTLPSLSQAQHHRKTKHKEFDIKCQHCAKRFSGRVRLHRHVPHCKEEKIPCDLCGRMFKNEAAIPAHKIKFCPEYKKSKEQEKKNAETSQSDETDSSAVEKISPSKPKCNYCDEEFSHQGYLFHHLKMCHELTKCNLCGITVLGISSTQNHKIISHKEPKYECPTCGKKFHRKVKFDEHCFACEHKRYFCKLCEGTFKHVLSIKPHYVKFHPGKNISRNIKIITVEETTISSTDDELTVDPSSNYDFSNIRSNAHSLADLSDDESRDSQVIDRETRTVSVATLNGSREKQVVSEKTSQSPTEYLSDEPFSCNMCGIVLQNYSQLHRHKLTKHREAKFKCPHCLRNFYFAKRFRVHSAYCATLKHACELCDQRFNHITRLQSHMKRDHHGKGPNTEGTDCATEKTQDSVGKSGATQENEAQPTIVPLDENIDLEMDIKVEETRLQEQEYHVPNDELGKSLPTTLHGVSNNDETEHADDVDNVIIVKEEYPEEDEEEILIEHQSTTKPSECPAIPSVQNESLVNQEPGQNGATCSICGLTFRKKTIMRYHMLVCHTDPLYKCSNCDRMFHRPYLLRGHEKSCSAKQCKKCGVWFPMRRKPNTHNVEKPEQHSPTETHFMCESCGEQ